MYFLIFWPILALWIKSFAVQLFQSHCKMTLHMISLTSKWPSMTNKTETDSCFSDPYPDPGWSWTRMSRLLPRNSANAISLLHRTSEGSWWLLLCPKISALNTESSEWHVIFYRTANIKEAFSTLVESLAQMTCSDFTNFLKLAEFTT